MKNYTIKQAANLERLSHRTIAKRIERDQKKKKKDRIYPNAFKQVIWFIPESDLK